MEKKKMIKNMKHFIYILNFKIKNSDEMESIKIDIYFKRLFCALKQLSKIINSKVNFFLMVGKSVN